ncbi:MAG: magnesium-translocating P-type ATPase [Firmicutes bacterium]|nr:magnesium-translocating P-type ATPase [Bacillota bacterium]
MRLADQVKKTEAFWNKPPSILLEELKSGPGGLSSDEAAKRLAFYGPNVLRAKRRPTSLALFLSQFKSPIILILIFASGVAFFLGDRTTSLIILVIILISGFLGFWQERGARDAVEKLLTIVEIKADVLRDGAERQVPIDEVVPGDIVALKAGDSIPGDCLILESRDLFANEATLTGETYPVEKSPGILPQDTPLGRLTNVLFMGTHVVSGSAKAVVVRTGKETEFGKISERLRLKPLETEFERGVRRFGYFLLEVTLILVVIIFAINVFLNRPVLDSFLFSLALAVGLTPQLLPAIITVNLAHGARRMAGEKVIVKRLASIENFGSMNVLCSDKTGTLTEGVVRVHSAIDTGGKESEKVFLYSYLNAAFESSFLDPIDEAIRTYRQPDISGYQKLDEVPYDFVRKRLSVLVSKDDMHLMITKGAVANILDVCSKAETYTGEVVDIAVVKSQVEQKFYDLSAKGFRVLGVAYRDVGSDSVITKGHETNMVFLGYLVLFDPPKAGIAETLDDLKNLGVSLKVITGDNRLVASSLCSQIGLETPRIITGDELHKMSNDALLGQVNRVNVFAEIEPNQKERILIALRRSGNVVGYLGDGINDGPALHAADVGVSVDSGADVAKEAAEIVLLEKDLRVLGHGVKEGRATFANTLKYVFMATSANFGNMFSMAGASLFLPFLPMLPTQILLTNLLTDFPEMTISTDSVDHELIDKPHRWDIKFIRSFMLVFGPLSSVFDYLTFGVLVFILRAGVAEFRTGWFVESVVSAALIVLVVRTQRAFFRSRPSKYLLGATLIIIGLTILIPFTPLVKLFSFTPLPPVFFPVLGVILVLYVIGAEVAKRIFYRRVVF